jgi:two-component system response regulator (stage 0 sporulation protein F)
MEGEMTTILVVDGQPNLRELFKEEMQNEGYGLISASDAEAARRLVKDSKPNLVLLDLYLNGFEGWKLLRDIKKSDPDLPVLIVTAYDNYNDDPQASEADGYIVKNFTAFETLKQRIADIFTGESSYNGIND